MNKKILSLILMCTMGIASISAQELVIKKKDGSAQTVGGKLYFKQKGDADKWSATTDANGEYSSANDISNIKSASILDGIDLELVKYQSPSYIDYYISAGSSWSDRAKWNLANIHDPSVMLAEDGYYYMYCTDAGYGNPHHEDVQGNKHGHFQCRRSKDLVNWEYMGATMYGLPSWVQPKLNEIRKAMGLKNSTANFSDDLQFGYWAPCARKVKDGLYRMYYCITCPGYIDPTKTSWGERAFIGVMETTDPSDLSKWEDKGYVITNYSDRDLSKIYVSPTAWESCYYKYNAIDPSYIITPDGEHWLIYGSWHSGFAAVEINPETGKTKAEQGNPWGAENEAAYGKRVYTRKMSSRWQGSEAPEVIYHDGYYYLFMAYDGLDIPYNTRVVRSENIDGPYKSMNGVDVTNKGGDAYPIVTHPYQLGGNHSWVGISHCAVFEDGNGNWYYASQQRFPADYNGNAYSNAVMLGGVRAIRWTDTGWPIVMPERYGAVPQAPITEEELIGKWEHISIQYKYGVAQNSVSMTLGADHKVLDGWNKGYSWSFDPVDNVLTINNTKLYLAREVDWEATPRKTTIVYAGYGKYNTTSNQRTYWGKWVGPLDDDEADEGEDENNVQIVGAQDFSSGFWSAFSDSYTIPAGNELKLKFVNHSSKGNNWNNWVIALTNDVERQGTGYLEYFVLRADNYAWWPTGNTMANPDAGFSLTSNYNWETFKNDMDGATVELTVSRKGSTISVDAVTTTTANNVYTESYSMPNCGDGTQPVRAFLVCDGTWFEIDNTALSIAPAN